MRRRETGLIQNNMDKIKTSPLALHELVWLYLSGTLLFIYLLKCVYVFVVWEGCVEVRRLFAGVSSGFPPSESYKNGTQIARFGRIRLYPQSHHPGL